MEWVIEMFMFIREWWFLIAFVGAMIVGSYKGIETINDTLIEIKNELKMSNTRFKTGEQDRENLWKKMYEHDGRLDSLNVTTARHEERINMFGGGK